MLELDRCILAGRMVNEKLKYVYRIGHGVGLVEKLYSCVQE